jgi:hypothetical protein
MTKKIKQKPLIAFNFKFYGVTPNVFQVDENGKQIGRPHTEVKNNISGKIFEAKNF